MVLFVKGMLIQWRLCRRLGAGGMPGPVPGAPQMAAGDAGDEVGRRGQHAYKAFVQSTGHGQIGQVCSPPIAVK